MALNRILQLINGVKTWVLPTQTSSGSSSAGAVVALNPSGLIDSTMLPPGATAGQRTATATAAISAGMWVNLYTVSGAQKARPADNSTAGQEANAYATAAVANAASGTFTLAGINASCSGLTADAYYALGTVGGQVALASVPTASGSVVQLLGKALSTTEIEFEFDYPVVNA